MAGPRGMVLPQHERTDGRIVESRTYAVSDVRLPRRLFHQLDYCECTVVGSFHRSETCPDGRHLFDVIESAHDVYGAEDDGSGDHERFRATMTCVRCGHLQAWDGTRTREFGKVNPTPLVAGGLVAQQTNNQRGSFDSLSTWLVYADDGDGVAEVGLITWGRGRRGRHFHQARLHDWPEGRIVEGPNPAAALKKLSRARRAAAAFPVAEVTAP